MQQLVGTLWHGTLWGSGAVRGPLKWAMGGGGRCSRWPSASAAASCAAAACAMWSQGLRASRAWGLVVWAAASLGKRPSTPAPCAGQHTTPGWWVSLLVLPALPAAAEPNLHQAMGGPALNVHRTCTALPYRCTVLLACCHRFWSWAPCSAVAKSRPCTSRKCISPACASACLAGTAAPDRGGARVQYNTKCFVILFYSLRAPPLSRSRATHFAPCPAHQST